MVMTSQAELGGSIRRLREHGMSVSAADRHASRDLVIEQYLETGFNFRMTDIQAAVGLVQLERLDEIVDAPAGAAPSAISDHLADVPGLQTVNDPPYGTHQLPVVLDRAPR